MKFCKCGLKMWFNPKTGKYWCDCNPSKWDGKKMNYIKLDIPCWSKGKWLPITILENKK